MRYLKHFLYIKLFFILNFTLFCTNINNIIFDIDGVLMLQDRFTIIANLMKTTPTFAMTYIAFNSLINGSSSMNELLFQTIAKYTGNQECNIGEHACDNHGNQLPHLLCCWQDGSLTSSQLNQKLWDTFFKNRMCTIKYQALWSICSFMLDPAKLASGMKPNKPMWEIIKKLKMYNLYILSNYASDSFDALYLKYTNLFAQIPYANFYISGKKGFIKPRMNCFNSFLNSYNLNPQECLFIDDQPINIFQAKKAGIINAFHYNYKKHEDFLKYIQNICII